MANAVQEKFFFVRKDCYCEALHHHHNVKVIKSSSKIIKFLIKITATKKWNSIILLYLDTVNSTVSGSI